MVAVRTNSPPSGGPDMGGDNPSVGELQKLVRRRAAEPSRVFAASDFRELRGPVWEVRNGATSWYGPSRAPWLMRDNEGRCLQRALALYDTKLIDGVDDQLVTLLTKTGAGVKLRDVEELAVPPTSVLPKGNTMPVHKLSNKGYVLATPVAYAERTWPDGEWRLVSTLWEARTPVMALRYEARLPEWEGAIGAAALVRVFAEGYVEPDQASVTSTEAVQARLEVNTSSPNLRPYGSN